MKKSFLMAGLAFAMLTMTSLSSCCNADDESNGTSNVPVVTPSDDDPNLNTPIVQNISVPSGYTSGLYTGLDGNTYLIKTDNGAQDGSIDKIYVIPNSGNPASGKNAVAMFANNKIRSITLDNVTYVFGTNQNNKIDVAVISGNNSELLTDVAESDLLKDVKGDTYPQTLSNAFMSYQDMLGVIANVNKMLDEKSRLKEAVEDIDPLLGNITDDIKEAELGDKDKLDDIISKDPAAVPDLFNEDDVHKTDSTSNDDTNRGNGAIVSGKGALKVTLTWFYSADIDLHVYEPKYVSETGHIYWNASNNSFCGGYLDIDNIRGYYIDPTTRYEYKNLAAVENIFWKENPDEGEYKVSLHYYSGSASGNCNVTVYVNGKSIYDTIVFVDNKYHDSYLHIGTVKMPEGTFTPAQNDIKAKGYKPFIFDDPKSLPAKKY